MCHDSGFPTYEYVLSIWDTNSQVALIVYTPRSTLNDNSVDISSWHQTCLLDRKPCYWFFRAMKGRICPVPYVIYHNPFAKPALLNLLFPDQGDFPEGVMSHRRHAQMSTSPVTARSWILLLPNMQR